MTCCPDPERRESPAKHATEALIAAAALAVLSPVLALLAVLVKITSPGPVLYRSERLGRDATLFTLYKFRSMRVGSAQKRASDGSLVVTTRDERVTSVGRLLRAGFDELPQLWNVVRGDMNLIGPRPDLPHALELYTGNQRERLRLRPGITGLAQVAGRTDIPWADRLALDVRYVRERTALMDLAIALRTVLELVPPLRRWSRDRHQSRSAAGRP